ncbi:KEOPS complex subunit Cgi121 [uncultured Methanosphaera sp.]|uniref:KEOPS complex subunit Cgi121 n=1 Tax=uncultured Methanosphaera sp. TaxID=262501 RepID=UPI0025F433F0|nr:KEOPS complex subunit Cgi121 [uncultured Methanosphaera sp.]
MNDLQAELLGNYNITIHSYEDNLIENVPDFLRKVDEVTSLKEDSIIQLLDTDYICGERHINQAISQAIKAFEENQNFANDKGLEICVRLSAQKQISEALKLLGIKNQCNITVVYINVLDEQIVKMEELLSNRNDDLLNTIDSNKIMKSYDLSSDKNMVDMINEKIALLAIKN